ncbi:MAG: alkaline phosphatase family protein [Sphingobacteriia bacterium]|nr:alkaline phosphatase family protein [Sphingobacteriia bacterium]NCC39697.1 alkaline phosphatase family protein [Gammaproteobacteria bacterium]
MNELGLDPDLLAPDYDGGGIVNLMSSLIQARGGRSDHPSLRGLPPHELAETRNLVLLVIDGLGAEWLLANCPDGILGRALRMSITSVFPSTTAAAIPSFLTGEAPARHGLTGWHTYFGELGCVMTVLPGIPRYGGVTYRQAGIDPQKLFTSRSVCDRISTRAILVSPAKIALSDFNLAHRGRGEIRVYEGLRDLFRQSARVIHGWGRRRRERKYLYLYWPKLDAIGHQQGMDSPAAREHLGAIERAIARFMDEIAGTDTCLVVSADHGQVDTGPEDVIDLVDHPELADTLLLPLCGEPRAAFCSLRVGAERQFLDYCEAHLARRVAVIPSERLVSAGYFGRGQSHPRLRERVGDYCLLPRGRALIRQWLPFETPYAQVGVHGGLSRSELLVPVCLLRA